jgi:hypothetical protein
LGCQPLGSTGIGIGIGITTEIGNEEKPVEWILKGLRFIDPDDDPDTVST